MRLRYCAAVVCLLAMIASGQSSGKTSTLTPDSIHGIKVFSSKFDGSSVQLDFMNDSPADITAWGFCVKAEKAHSDDPDQSFCTWTDALPTVTDRNVHEQITLKPILGDSPDGHFIHSGEHKIVSANFFWPVTSAGIAVNLVVYANGTVEAQGNEGAFAARQIAQARQNMLQTARTVAGLGQSVLQDQTEQHPAESMIFKLKDRTAVEPALQGTLQHFERPEWRKANNTAFIPKDERGYLSQFVTEQQMKAAEFSRHQLQGVSQ